MYVHAYIHVCVFFLVRHAENSGHFLQYLREFEECSIFDGWKTSTIPHSRVWWFYGALNLILQTKKDKTQYQVSNSFSSTIHNPSRMSFSLGKSFRYNINVTTEEHRDFLACIGEPGMLWSKTTHTSYKGNKCAIVLAESTIPFNMMAFGYQSCILCLKINVVIRKANVPYDKVVLQKEASESEILGLWSNRSAVKTHRVSIRPDR